MRGLRIRRDYIRQARLAGSHSHSVQKANRSALITVTPAVFMSASNLVATSLNPLTAEQQSLSKTMSDFRPRGQASRRCRTDQFTQCDLASPQHRTFLCFASVLTKSTSRSVVGSSGTCTSLLSALYISARLFWPLK